MIMLEAEEKNQLKLLRKMIIVHPDQLFYKASPIDFETQISLRRYM